MTIFPAHRLPETGPRYVAIADAIEAAMAAGELAPGDRLPAHRPLAFDLGVTVGTIARAYELAARRGLVEGAVGRGTFIRAEQDPGARARGVGSAEFTAMEAPGLIPMRANLPAPAGQAAAVTAALEHLLRDPGFRLTVADYTEPGGTAPQRAAMAHWLSRPGFIVSPDNVVMTAGAQQALATAIAAGTAPGDLILAEALTYRVVAAQCQLMGRRLKPVAIDEGGIVPEAFEDACRTHRPAALVTIPTLQNPTGSVMDETRRKRIAAIARSHGVALIEDDIYGGLTDAPAPLASHAPDTGFYVSSLSKCVAPGLRIGAVVCPPRHAARIRAAQHAFGQGLPPAMSEVARHLVETGTADTLLASQRKIVRTRNTMAREALGDNLDRANPHSPHLWLRLPEPWRTHAFVEAARTRGLAIAADEDFAIGAPPAEPHVRLALGAPRNDDELEKGIGILAGLLAEGPLGNA